MLLTASDLIAYGFRISGTPEAVIVRAIEDAELGTVKSQIGDDVYIRLLSAPECGDDHIILNGGVYGGRFVGGIKRAEAHLAFALLLAYSVNSTSFGAVRKTDDHSRPATYDEVMAASLLHIQHYETYMRDICAAMKIKYNHGLVPNIQAI